MKQLPDFFWADRLKPVHFYGYRSSVKDRVIEFEVHGDENKEKYFDEIKRFQDLKIKCMATPLIPVKEDGSWGDPVTDVWDNKIVIECMTEQGNTIFVGYYDCIFSIGLGVKIMDWQKPWVYTQ